MKIPHSVLPLSRQFTPNQMVPLSGLSLLVLITVLSSYETTQQITCPCGNSGQSFIRIPSHSDRRSDECDRFRFCQTCRDFSNSCSSCPPGYSGSLCEKSSFHMTVPNDVQENSKQRRSRSINCPDFPPMKLVDITCMITSREKECTGKCVIGHTFIGHGGDEMVLKCTNGRWSPITAFPECQSTGLCDIEIVSAGDYNCSTGAQGTTCNIFCHPHHNGKYSCVPGQGWSPPLPPCMRENVPTNVVAPSCDCMNNGRCDAATGDCTCPLGYRGRYCEIAPANTVPSCDCANNGRCDAATGRCTCPVGYRGRHCEIAPPNIATSCRCENGGRCEAATGGCTCPVGYRGRYCEIAPSNIPVSCRCENGGQCNTATRRCVCQPGYRGSQCETAISCHCENDGKCDYATGGCICPPGYRGRLCETAIPCQCKNNGECDYARGSCICPVGYRGRLCEIAPSNAVSPCRCENGGRCDQGTRRCICQPGYRGRLCETAIPCHCQNGGKCDYATGNCICPAGYRGRLCETGSPSKQVYCDEPGMIANGYLNNDDGLYKEGATVTYICDPGFTLRGKDTLTCLRTGQWSAHTPTCERPEIVQPTQVDTCEEPEDIANGWKSILTTTFSVGSVVSYKCNREYEMAGDGDLICMENRQWSTEKPTCVRKEDKTDVNVDSCPYIDPPANSLVRVKNPSGSEAAWSAELKPNTNNRRFSIGSRIRYRCKSNYYELYGSEYQTCRDTGAWSGSRPTCVPECGKSDTPRTPNLTNGTATSAGQWPWQVAIFTINVRTRRENFTCGGSLLNEKWVLTAAHCVAENPSSTIAMSTRLIVAYAGKHYKDLSRRDTKVQKKQVRQILIHEEYDYVRFDADIALIEFDSPVELTARVKPICLPTDSTTRENVIDGKRGVVIGWGQTEHKQLSDELLEIVIPVVSHSKCEHSFREQGQHITVTDNMFCAGYDNGHADTCTGDSGGPMMFLDESQIPNRWVLEGIVSWGSEHGCGAKSRYSGFTKVNQFLQWIKMHI